MAKKIFGACVVALMLWMIASFANAVWIGQPAAGSAKRVTIGANQSLVQVIQQLETDRVITHPWWYRVYSWMSFGARHPKAGTYDLQPGERYSSIAAILALGVQSDEVKLQVIEGWSMRDVRTLLIGQGVAPDVITHSLGQEGDRAPFDGALRLKYAFLASLPPKRSLEGYLFPDTYRVWKGQLPTSLIIKQLDEFNQRFGSTSVTAASAPLTNLDQVVTLASIVEKEVADPAERKVVAGIFLRRLKEHIPLQSDATVNYFTQSGRSRATSEDLSIENAYNTYKHPGLPPGPISNPGADAIDAVLHPTPSPYRYFLTDEQGRIYYASTLEEHAANRRKAGI